MSAASHPRMTAEAFVAWAMQQPEGVRYELEAGELVAMAPERSLHALTKFDVARRLADAVARSGQPCTVYPDGMGVPIDAETIYEPDAMVRRGPPLPDDATLAPDPVIVVEVRSPSTGNRDAGVKFAGYFRVASVRHYLIVIAGARTIIHHMRGPDGTITTTIVRDGPVPLDPPGIVLDGVWPPAPPEAKGHGSTPA